MADQVQAFALTTQEAVEAIKKAPAGSEFAVHVVADAPIAGRDDEVIQDGLASYVDLSRKTAVRLAETLLSPVNERAGGRIRLSIHSHSEDGKSSVTYWLC